MELVTSCFKARHCILSIVLAFALTVCKVSAETTTISPGPLQSERQALLKDINAMEKAGAGVKLYTQAFEELEGLVKANAQEEAIKAKLDKLKESLQKQKQTVEKIKADVHFSKSVKTEYPNALHKTKSRPLSRTTPLSRYCGSVEDAIRKVWKPVAGTDDNVSIDFSVDELGVIKNIVANKNSSGSASAQNNVIEKIRSVGRVCVPPGHVSKLNLRLQICKKHGIEVGPNVDYSDFMADLERRIKRAWFPPKHTQSTHVVVSFRVRSDGRISDECIETSSGEIVTDQAAIRALQNAAPFRPLPAGSIEEVEIEFKFDYNVNRGSMYRKF